MKNISIVQIYLSIIHTGTHTHMQTNRIISYKVSNPCFILSHVLIPYGGGETHTTESVHNMHN